MGEFMSRMIFPAIETFKVFRKRINGADLEITDTELLNIVRKWIVPYESKGINSGSGEGVSYENASLTSAAAVIHGKPFMITTEKLDDGQEHIIFYTFDPKPIPPPPSGS